MAKRTPPPQCSAPGCTETIKRGMLMCRPHWFRLPPELRRAIVSAWKDRRLQDWSANILAARGFLANANRAAFDHTQRLLGERPDP